MQPNKSPRTFVRAVLLAVVAVLIGLLVALTLGASVDLIIIAALFIPVSLAWRKLCGTLQANELALDATLGDTTRSARQRYGRKATRPSEVQR